MGQKKDGKTRHAPLCIRKFNPDQSYRVSNSYEIIRQHNSYQEIDDISDRLRWGRRRKKMKQEEVAGYLGIQRSSYAEYESGKRNAIPKWMVDRLSELFDIPAKGLLDDYNRFLYYGQREAIRECIENKESQTDAFAELIRTDPQRIARWENNVKQVSKKSWEKYFSHG